MNPLPETLLYPTESREELARMAAQLRTEYSPADPFEEEVFSRLLEAAWCRRRYERVRSRLYDRKRQLASDAPQLAVTIASIRRFQHEVEQAKKSVANLRKTLRRYRAGELPPVAGEFNDHLLAA
jgi:hypothetical protein